MCNKLQFRLIVEQIFMRKKSENFGVVQGKQQSGAQNRIQNKKLIRVYICLKLGAKASAIFSAFCACLWI